MLQRVWQIFEAMALAVVGSEIDAAGNGAKGAEKKAAAIAKFTQALTGVLPSWSVAIAANSAEWLCETLLNWAKSKGFFSQLLADLSSELKA